jgi:hypothetical protein
MSATLADIVRRLKDVDKKVQLIYAFNGTGKTRLSKEFINLITFADSDPNSEETQPRKILYYNAHTEDLFYWDNDLEFDTEPKLKIQPNSFTGWILEDQGLDQQIINNFQRLAGSRITPVFDENNTGVTFTVSNTSYLVTEDGQRLTTEDGNWILGDANDALAKISRGEESNFVWSIFYTLIEQVIAVLNVVEPEDRDTNQFDHLKYIFIDDPVSSLDENHLIELAVNLAELITSAPPELKFIISTHNPLFYNVLHSHLKLSDKRRKDGCYLLEALEDGTYNLSTKYGATNSSFSYHLHLKKLLEDAVKNGRVEKYHFNLLRNLYEKTASYLGYEDWTDLLDTLPEGGKGYHRLIINMISHSRLSSEEATEPTEPQKQSVKLLLDNLVNNYGFAPKKEDND